MQIEDAIDTLAELFSMHGVPKHIRSDNGPEFIANAIQRWFQQLSITALYVEPGSPWENGYAESFFSRFRDEFLALEEFEDLTAARMLTSSWRKDYNHHRPHSSLGYLTPVEFAARNRCGHPLPIRIFITRGTENQSWSSRWAMRRATAERHDWSALRT